MIKRKAPINRMRDDLYTHYLCIQMKMMMLTSLDGHIAAPNHIFAQNDVFLRVLEVFVIKMVSFSEVMGNYI